MDPATKQALITGAIALLAGAISVLGSYLVARIQNRANLAKLAQEAQANRDKLQQDAKTNAETVKDSLVDLLNEQLGEQAKFYDAKIERIKRDYDEQLQEQDRRFAKKLEQLAEQHMASISQVRAEAKREAKDQYDALDKEYKRVNELNGRLYDRIDRLKAELERVTGEKVTIDDDEEDA